MLPIEDRPVFTHDWQRLRNARDHLISAQQYLHWVRSREYDPRLSATPPSEALPWAVQNFYRQLDNVWACQCMVRGEGAGL